MAVLTVAYAFFTMPQNGLRHSLFVISFNIYALKQCVVPNFLNTSKCYPRHCILLSVLSLPEVLFL